MRPVEFARTFRPHSGLWLSLLCGSALKAAILLTNSITFDADEAILALMARHILQGERPLFFYGQSYMGALDAYLIALSFLIFGQTVLAARLVQVGLYLGVLTTTYLVTYRLTTNRFSATASSLMIGVPPVMFSLYTTSTLGDYAEILLLSNLLYLLGWDLLTGRKSHVVWWLAAGVLAGLGWWSMALIVVPLIALTAPGLRWLREHVDPGKVLWLFCGFALGAAPWIAGTLQRGAAATLGDLSGAWFTGSIGDGAPRGVAYHLIALVGLDLPALFGIRPSWSLDWIILPLGVVIAGFYLTVLWRAGRITFSGVEVIKWSDKTFFRACLLLAWAVLVALFLATPFGGDPTGRYLLPLWPVLAVLVGEWLGRLRRRAAEISPTLHRMAAGGILALLLIYNLWGNVRAIVQNPPGLTKQFDPISQIPHDHDQALIAFLDSIGADRGYSNYWVTFRFAFLTNERIIFSPRLPYKADLSYTYADDRYPPYREAVERAANPVYVTSNHPVLDAEIRRRLAGLGVTFREAHIGPYTVFYDISRRVTPDELGPFGEVSGRRIHGDP